MSQGAGNKVFILLILILPVLFHTKSVLILATWHLGNKLFRKFAARLNHQLKYNSLYCLIGLECYKHCSLYTTYPYVHCTPCTPMDDCMHFFHIFISQTWQGDPSI